MEAALDEFQSPQWGDNSKPKNHAIRLNNCMFQSPQWGDNSKGTP